MSSKVKLLLGCRGGESLSKHKIEREFIKGSYVMSYLELFDFNHLALKCNFEEKDKAKSIGDYVWYSPSKRWLYPFRKDIVDSIKKIFPEILISPEVEKKYLADEKFQKLAESTKKLKDCIVEESFLKKPLFRHQRVGVKYLSLFEKVACFDDMGLGKSLQALYLAILRKEKEHKCLILCPKSVKISVWANQIERFTNEDSLVIEGPKVKRERLYQQFKRNKTYFMISSYETFRVSFKKLAGLNLINSTQNNCINFLIADEVTKCKNPQSQIGKLIKKLKTKYSIILTGTPMWNRIEDIWNIIEIISPGLLGKNYWSFSDKYLIKGGFQNHEITGYKNLDDLKRKINSISIRRTKEEVESLPPKIKENRILELDNKEQKEAYKSMREEMIVFVKTLKDEEVKVKAGQLLTRNLRLSQITDGFLTDYTLKKTKYYKKASKLKEIAEIIDDYAFDRQIVIFTRWLAIIDYLYKLYQASPIFASFLCGRLGDKDRDYMIKKFQSGKSRVMIAQINTGGMGIDLSSASIQIFLDKAFISSAVLTQAEDRSHRHGQKKTLEIISLICKDTIDERWEKLMEKKQKGIAKFFPQSSSFKKKDWLYLLEK